MLKLFTQSHMRKLLEVDISLAQNILDELKVHHRTARSFDFFGTGLKVMAGTPDARNPITFAINNFVHPIIFNNKDIFKKVLRQHSSGVR